MDSNLAKEFEVELFFSIPPLSKSFQQNKSMDRFEFLWIVRMDKKNAFRAEVWLTQFLFLDAILIRKPLEESLKGELLQIMFEESVLLLNSQFFAPIHN